MKEVVVTFKDKAQPTKRYYKAGRVRYEGAFVIVPWEESGWHGAMHEHAFPAADVLSVEVEGEE